MNKQLECRVVITHGHRPDLKTELGMYDPVSGRYAPLGAHGPGAREVDRVVCGLKERIEREGHLLTFSVCRGPRAGTVVSAGGRSRVLAENFDPCEVLDALLSGVGHG